MRHRSRSSVALSRRVVRHSSPGIDAIRAIAWVTRSLIQGLTALTAGVCAFLLLAVGGGVERETLLWVGAAVVHVAILCFFWRNARDDMLVTPADNQGSTPRLKGIGGGLKVRIHRWIWGVVSRSRIVRDGMRSVLPSFGIARDHSALFGQGPWATQEELERVEDRAMLGWKMAMTSGGVGRYLGDISAARWRRLTQLIRVASQFRESATGSMSGSMPSPLSTFPLPLQLTKEQQYRYGTQWLQILLPALQRTGHLRAPHGLALLRVGLLHPDREVREWSIRLASAHARESE